MSTLKKFQLTTWLASVDCYAQPLGLTYKQSKGFPTARGGCFTLVHFTVAIVWLAYSALSLREPVWGINTFESSNLLSNDSTPLYRVDT